MKTSKNGIDFIKSHESFRSLAYDDLNPNVTVNNVEQLQGVLTIGYGHTSNVSFGQIITEDQAEQLLKDDLLFAEMSVKNFVKVPLNQNMFDALVSFVFNVGEHNFATKQYGGNSYVGSTLLQRLNEGKFNEASERFKDFNKSGGQVLNGLVRRRKEESELFLNGLGVLTYFNVESGSISDGEMLNPIYIVKKKTII